MILHPINIYILLTYTSYQHLHPINIYNPINIYILSMLLLTTNSNHHDSFENRYWRWALIRCLWRVHFIHQVLLPLKYGLCEIWGFATCPNLLTQESHITMYTNQSFCLWSMLSSLVIVSNSRLGSLFRDTAASVFPEDCCRNIFHCTSSSCCVTLTFTPINVLWATWFWAASRPWQKWCMWFQRIDCNRQSYPIWSSVVSVLRNKRRGTQTLMFYGPSSFAPIAMRPIPEASTHTRIVSAHGKN